MDQGDNPSVPQRSEAHYQREAWWTLLYKRVDGETIDVDVNDVRGLEAKHTKDIYSYCFLSIRVLSGGT